MLAREETGGGETYHNVAYFPGMFDALRSAVK
jgi:hypothetical protein